MRKLISTSASVLLLLLASPMTLAQETSFPGRERGGGLMPSADEMAKAQAKAREAMSRVPPAGVPQQPPTASMPKVGSIPRPAAPAPDIASIAEKYNQLGRSQAQQAARQPDLLVFVSLSMPKEALERIASQAQKAGATLLFRGLKGDSMAKMTEEVRKIIGNRDVSIAIHPPAFQQFSVARVPAVVIARPEAGSVLDNGCAPTDTFVKVSGDVSLDYALDYIERRSPTWAAVARQYRDKIVRGIN